MAALAHSVHEHLFAGLRRASTASADDYLASARRTLERLVTQTDLLADVTLERKPGGFTRNLLFGDGVISIWAMVWSPGCETSIHDHHCSCCFAVTTGVLREIWFRPISDTHAVATAEAERRPGYIACMMPTGPNIHQMINSGTEEAISIHVYGYDHNLHATSVDRTYEAARI